MVGKGYKQGKYVVRNLETAIQYFSRSAEMGCPLGYYFIGKEYYYGRYIEQSYTKATKYFKLALNAEPRAGYYLYNIHKIRNDPKIDGLEMLKIGVEFGHKKALFKYGKLLYNGDEGVAKNEKEGKKCIRQAVFQKCKDAIKFCILHHISMKKKKVETKEVDTGPTDLKNSIKNNDNENRRESNSVSFSLSIKEYELTSDYDDTSDYL